MLTLIPEAGPVGITAAQISQRTGLSKAQTKAAVAVVLTMRRTVPDVDAACTGLETGG